MCYNPKGLIVKEPLLGLINKSGVVVIYVRRFALLSPLESVDPCRVESS